MSFAPLAPTIRVEPTQVAPDTWVLHHVQQALGAPLFVQLNSMVITGEEPLIIDTNTIANRSQWLDDAFGIVEPEDVRWVYLSHDDVDHTGNLEQVMERCVNATIVCNWAMTERHTNAFDFPIERCRWVDDGDSFDAGDRTFLAVRPPVYDSPTTRGLLDQKTGVYWGVDAFACPMLTPDMENVADYDAGFWAEGMAMFLHNVLSPWLALVDPQKYAAVCDRVRALGMNTIVTAHSPVITEPSIDKAFQILRDLPSVPAPPVPNQAVLEAILSGEAPPPPG